MKHNRVGAAAVWLGDGDRCAEAAVCEVPVQAVASAVATMRSVTHKRIYSVNAGGLQVVTSQSGHLIRPDKDMWRRDATRLFASKAICRIGAICVCQGCNDGDRGCQKRHPYGRQESPADCIERGLKHYAYRDHNKCGSQAPAQAEDASLGNEKPDHS